MTPVVPPLDEHTVNPDPVTEFLSWYRTAVESGIPQPDAMTLATATEAGEVSARMVLLKHAGPDGFVFYTNYQSRKGKELARNPSAALVFFWADLDRSVRVEGTVAKVPAEESDAYFAGRPRDGRLSALASRQSEPVADRNELDRRFEDLTALHAGKPVPRPAHWGGYRLIPRRIEFWQRRFARLNDRVLYERRTDGTWTKTRLQP